MKKILTAIWALILVFTLVSLNTLSNTVQNIVNGFKDHTHVFGVIDSKAATCDADGYETSKCFCGEEKTVVLPAGHDNQIVRYLVATCTEDGEVKYKCRACDYTETVIMEATGHSYDEDVEASRLRACHNPKCESYAFAEGDGKYAELLTYTFNKDNEAEIEALYEEIYEAIVSAPEYDPALHAYAEEGEIYEMCEELGVKVDKLLDLRRFVSAQWQIAMVLYRVNMSDPVLEENFSYISAYRSNLLAKIASFDQLYYDSCYREFYFYGLSEEEMDDFLFESNARADEEFVALNIRNSEIMMEYYSIGNVSAGEEVPLLYAELVENNKRIAEILGYNNYLEYEYKEGYGREYSYLDIQQMAEYVKEYLPGIYAKLYEKHMYNLNQVSYSQADFDGYLSQVSYSFFENIDSNTAANDYLDLLAFTSNPDKTITFSDALNDLMSNGNLFRGEYQGAYETYISAYDFPIVYFGSGYEAPFTVIHEFGHYMNDLYNGTHNNLSQSFDLFEVHSQGNEMLYLSFLKDRLTKEAFNLTETYVLLYMYDGVMTGLAIDTFEQAVYLGSYEGTYSDIIMADGKITYDEYDLLYRSVLEDFGVTGYAYEQYWRMVVVDSACYFISYGVSALAALQIYMMASTEGFDVAKDAYLKLFTYTDVEGGLEMTTEEAFEYAGMYFFNDEEIYISLKEFFGTI